MKTTNLILPITVLSGALFLASCAEDPSENVAPAEVTEVEEAETLEVPAEPKPPVPAPEPLPAPSEVEPAPPEVEPAPPETAPEPAEPTAPETEEASAPADAVSYAFTDASKIEFVGSKVTGSHDGGFEKFTGNFEVAGDKPGQGPHKIEIDTTSLWSDNEKLTGHLKSADFFDVEKFPTSTFMLNSVEEAEGDDMYTLNGELDLHGTRKIISFPAKITTEDKQVHLNAEFSINRRDFGINYDGKANDLIRDGVVIKLVMVAEPQ